MTSPGSILLLETDQATIKDITCSLRLIGIPVMTSVSVEEAVETAKKYHPALVLARYKINGTTLGLELAKSLQTDSQLNTVPVYGLCQIGEQNELEEVRSSFTGRFLLPVEFPAFAKDVQEILGNHEGPRPEVQRAGAFAKPATQNNNVFAPKENVAPKLEKPAESKTAELLESEVRDRNFALAYAIQSKVLRELENDGRLSKVAVEQVPGILNQVTAKVCIKYATEKILS